MFWSLFWPWTDWPLSTSTPIRPCWTALPTSTTSPPPTPSSSLAATPSASPVTSTARGNLHYKHHLRCCTSSSLLSNLPCRAVTWAPAGTHWGAAWTSGARCSPRLPAPASSSSTTAPWCTTGSGLDIPVSHCDIYLRVSLTFIFVSHCDIYIQFSCIPLELVKILVLQFGLFVLIHNTGWSDRPLQASPMASRNDSLWLARSCDASTVPTSAWIVLKCLGIYYLYTSKGSINIFTMFFF